MESMEERATTTATERTEEQWAPASTDILSQLWDNITEAKKAVKIWILDRGESWAPSNHTNRIRLQLHCLISTCTFYIRVAQKKRGGLFTVTSYSPHNCPPSTHANFKPRNAAWYIASCLERDITITGRSNQRRFKSEVEYIINFSNYHISQLGELESDFEIHLMGMKAQALT
jgi:hypothetical protein